MATSNQLRYTFHLNGEPTNQKLNEIFRQIARALRTVEGRHGLVRIRAPLVITVASDEEAPIQVVEEGTGQDLPGSTPVTGDDLDEATGGSPTFGDYTGFYWRDDFVAGMADILIPGPIGDTGFMASRNSAYMTFAGAGGTGHPGVWKITCANGGAATDYAFFQHASGPYVLDGVGTLTMIVKYEDGLARANAVQFGFKNAYGWDDGIDVSGGAYVEMTSGDSNFYCVTANGTNKSRTAGPAYTSNWQKIDIVHDPDVQSWAFYFDDVHYATHTSGSEYVPLTYLIQLAGGYLEHPGSNWGAALYLDLYENVAENLDRGV